MKFVQRVLLKLIGLSMFFGGALAVAMWWEPSLRALYLHQFKIYVWSQYGMAAGCGVVLIGLICMLPSGRKRAHNVISFPGVHGDVSIELDSVESTLMRMVSKMPEVKKIRIHVVPADDHRRVKVKADVLVYKGASPSSAREIANRITDYLTDTAVNMLGVEDVTTVDLNVRGIVMDPRPVPPAKAEEPAPKADEVAPKVEEAVAVPADSVSSEDAAVVPAEPPEAVEIPDMVEMPVSAGVSEPLEMTEAVEAPVFAEASEVVEAPAFAEVPEAVELPVPAEEPATPFVEAAAAEPPAEIPYVFASENLPVTAEVPAPVGESEGAWMAGDPQDTVAPAFGAISDEVADTACAGECRHDDPFFDAELPPLVATEPVPGAAGTVAADSAVDDVDTGLADDTKHTADADPKSLGGFGNWDDMDRSVKRLEE